jgi:magnesium-transporting ATPase (P-type)
MVISWTDADDDTSKLDPQTLLPGGDASHDRRPYMFAVTGKAFQVMVDRFNAAKQGRTSSDGINWKELFPLILLNCGVFARMSPDQKAECVEQFAATGLFVGMCGDGANDGLALRSAHVGVSLSTVEASVSAPFTSAIPDISCVPLILAEGRGSLATSVGLFDFLALYSVIQFSNALLVVFCNSFLSNAMYLWQDLFIVALLALSLGSTPASHKLTKKRPTGRLLSAYNLTLAFFFMLATVAAQAIVFFQVRKQPWYNTTAYPNAMVPSEDKEGVNAEIPETSSVFLMASFQYVAVAYIFSDARPWKQAVHMNLGFSTWLLVVFAVSLLLLALPWYQLYGWLSLQKLPSEWLRTLVLWSLFAMAVYFIVFYAARYARRRGVFTQIEQRIFGVHMKQHKLVRKQLARIMQVVAGESSSLPPDGNTIVSINNVAKMLSTKS